MRMRVDPRHRAADGLERPEAGVSEKAPRVAAIVLAAGRSSRMGEANKLIADLGGKPMVRRTVDAVLASRIRPIIVVTGHQAAEVSAALAGLDVILVTNPDFATGLASSLKAGVRALPQDCAGALVVLGDMPRIAPEHLDRLIEAFECQKGAAIIVPVHGGRQGNPVLWPAAYFPELLQLEGDAGAKRLIAAHPGDVREVDLGTDAIFVDVDTPEALARERGSDPSR
jgi:molybdenum cofactor cytidylyltransferase